MCEDGTLDAVKSRTGALWLVFEDSFLKWIRDLDAGH
jgi:hypothetical protein